MMLILTITPHTFYPGLHRSLLAYASSEEGKERKLEGRGGSSGESENMRILRESGVTPFPLSLSLSGTLDYCPALHYSLFYYLGVIV